MKQHLKVLKVLSMAALAFGCSDSIAADKQALKVPPREGTPVVVREHRLNLKLVRDAKAGLLQAYLCDGEFSKFVSVPETNFTLRAKVDGREERAEFVRVPAEGASTKNESWLFEARAEWVKTAAKFDGVIPTATFKGRTYKNIAFPFPKGTQHDH